METAMSNHGKTVTENGTTFVIIDLNERVHTEPREARKCADCSNDSTIYGAYCRECHVKAVKSLENFKL